MLIHSSNVRGKIVASWCRNSSPSPACRMDTRETPAAKAVEAAAPWREPGDTCTVATERTFLTQEEMVLAQTGLYCLLLPKKEKSHMIIWLHPKWFSMSQISLQIKNRTKINIGVRLTMNLREKMTRMICLATRQGNENSSIMLKKKVLIIKT